MHVKKGDLVARGVSFRSAACLPTKKNTWFLGFDQTTYVGLEVRVRATWNLYIQTRLLLSRSLSCRRGLQILASADNKKYVNSQTEKRIRLH